LSPQEVGFPIILNQHGRLQSGRRGPIWRRLSGCGDPQHDDL